MHCAQQYVPQFIPPNTGGIYNKKSMHDGYFSLVSIMQVDVNGPNTAPIYKFLKSSAGGFLGDLVKWNFEKFLVDKNGKVVERYPPTTSPFQIEVCELHL